jgi:hypothetical protein
MSSWNHWQLAKAAALGRAAAADAIMGVRVACSSQPAQQNMLL